jgi:hypothetical protein
MARLSSLWIGKPLSIVHKIGLSSFLYYGHEIKLYVYDMELDVPPGVIKVDANSIVPKSEIFLHYGKLAAFSDYFRYEMILKTNEMWVDVDTICLSEYFFDDKEYVFIEEAPNVYAGGVLKMPSNSDLSIFLNKRAKSIKSFYVDDSSVNFENSLDWKSWTYLGPNLLTDAVTSLSLQKYSQPASLTSVIDINREDPFDLLWNPANYSEMIKRVSPAIALTFFNSWIDQRNLNKDNFIPGSMIWELNKKFLGEGLAQ